MKIRLRGKEIDPTTVQHVRRIGNRITQIELITGETIRVICGVNVSDGRSLISYKGTFEELKEFIDRHKLRTYDIPKNCYRYHMWESKYPVQHQKVHTECPLF